METILKFFDNDSPDGTASVISRTLGKIAIVAQLYKDRAKRDASVVMPQPQEFWRVRILKELQKGKRSGCFIVEPLAKVSVDDLLHLVPGTYTIEVVDGKMLVRPNDEYKNRSCILPLDHKHVFAKRNDSYCVIVDLTPPKVRSTPTTKHNPGNPYAG
jgi:hypothetical protein